MTFRPSIYNNQRPLLTPADLDNHPLAAEYIEYMRHMRYPTHFQDWLARRENESAAQIARNAMTLQAMQSDPFCRSPLKRRRT